MLGFDFNEIGECERCRLEKSICRTGVCKSCLEEMIALRKTECKPLREKRLRALNSTENGILRSLGSKIALETNQAPPKQGISFPKILKERDIRRTQKALSRASIQRLLNPSPRRFNEASLVIQAVVEPCGRVPEGEIVRPLAPAWKAIMAQLRKDWTQAFQISARIWEELIAAAFEHDGYDEVILTPRSGDHGRDVIATKRGIGCVRIIGSVKAYAPHHLVRHDDVRALAGVLHTDHRASKGIVTTTSDFAPGILTDPFLAPLMPFRLELLNGARLMEWFGRLEKEAGNRW